jgi:outer membrane protein
MTSNHGLSPRPLRGMRRRSLAAALAFGAAAAFAVPSVAQERPYDFKLFGNAARIAPQGDSALPGVASSVEASSETGLEIGGEWRASERFGLEVAYLDAEHDVKADGTAIGTIDLRPWTVTANFHLVSNDTMHWYIGPSVSYINWSDIRLNGGGSLGVDGETAYGVSTGLDIDVGENFAVLLGLRWLDASVDSDSLPNEVSVDPLTARVGVAFRF